MIVYRGKGDNYRLGHGIEEHVRYPKLVEGLAGKKVVDFDIGLCHCIALTDKGEVYGWGRNDSGQLGEYSGTSPGLIASFKGKNTGACCGLTQVHF